jgi:hypothetical protein
MITLNENPKADNKLEYKYKLRGLIEHIGKHLKGGHYVYHWLNDDKSWYTFDDSEAKPWSESTQNTEKKTLPPLGNGYIYLYERVGNKDSSLDVKEEEKKDDTYNRTNSVPSQLDQTSNAITNVKVLVRRPYNNDRKHDILPYNAFVTLDDPGDNKIYNNPWSKFVEKTSEYKPFWFSKNDSLKAVDDKSTTWFDDQENNMKSYEVVDYEFIQKDAKGGRRRTRKNKRRITKRKVNKNKNKGKTKKH